MRNKTWHHSVINYLALKAATDKPSILMSTHTHTHDTWESHTHARTGTKQAQGGASEEGDIEA